MDILDSKPLQNCTSAQQNYLMADCVAAKITCESAVQWDTHAKQARVWKRWWEYNKCIGNNDLFLEHFSQHQQIKIIGAFALALWERRFLGPAYDQLVESTISGTVSYVCTTFRENGFPNPSLDKDARSGFLLQQLYWGFKNSDPAEKHQKGPSQCVSSQRLEKRQSLSSPLQFPNLPALQSSLHADLANTSRYQLPTNAEQQSFNFATSDSSGMANSSATMMQN